MAVLYSFILAVFVYREVGFKDVPKILLRAGETTAVVFLLIGTSMAMSWVLAAEQIPQNVSAALLGLTSNGIILMLLVNLILLTAGTFLDMTPAVLIFTPVFLPVAESIGITPLHLGIIMIMNLCIGLCTPPVGTCLFLGCAIGKTTVAKIIRQMLVFFTAMIAVLLLCTYVPSLSLWLPGKLGLLQP
ncbi:MAG: TRAP transporter large permease subunit [Planctomycetota bacterium]